MIFGVFADTIATVPTIDVQCDKYIQYTCLIDGSLNVHEDTILNFIDANAWHAITKMGISPQHNMTVLPMGIFKEFPKLREFEVESELQTINKENFQNANDLIELKLNQNHLQIIPSNVFQYAANLEIIMMERNQIHTIQDFAFNGLANLQYINLAFNHIRSLPDNAFTGAPSLIMVNVNVNELTHIGNSFRNLEKLQQIYINHNKIEDIKLNELVRLPALQTITMRDSGFRSDSIGEWTGATTPTITFLDISNNYLPEQDILNKLKFLVNLESLFIHDNNFRDVDVSKVKQLFPNLYSLRT